MRGMAVVRYFTYLQDDSVASRQSCCHNINLSMLVGTGVLKAHTGADLPRQQQHYRIISRTVVPHRGGSNIPGKFPRDNSKWDSEIELRRYAICLQGRICPWIAQ